MIKNTFGYQFTIIKYETLTYQYSKVVAYFVSYFQPNSSMIKTAINVWIVVNYGPISNNDGMK